jgi:hypothetical protein
MKQIKYPYLNMFTKNNDLVTLGLLPYHLQWLISEFARSNSEYYVRYGDNYPFVHAMDLNTSSYLKLSQDNLLDHLIGRNRIAVPPGLMMKFFSINLLCPKEQVSAYLKIITEGFGIPLIVVTKNSRVYSCCYFLRTFEEKENIIKAIDYSLEKILNPETLQFFKTFPGSAKWFELPFGRGSSLINPITMQPMKMNKRTMIEYCIRYQQNTTLTLNKLLHNVEGLSYE